MDKPVYYDCAYPGSMFDKPSGSFVERTDNKSLAGALLDNIEQMRRELEDSEYLARLAVGLRKENKEMRDLLNESLELIAAGPEGSALAGRIKCWLKANE